MVKKWYEVDMNNSKNQSFYGKQREEDLKEMFKTFKAQPEPEPELELESIAENFETEWFNDNNFTSEYIDEFYNQWFTDNNYINQDNEDFEGVDWDE